MAKIMLHAYFHKKENAYGKWQIILEMLMKYEINASSVYCLSVNAA